VRIIPVWHAARVGRPPDWLLLGAPRSGTTTLSTFLDEHPGAYLAPGKELSVLDRDELSDDDVAAYFAAFAGALPDQKVGEATPHYLSSVRTPDRVARLCPDARLAAILRDPTDRAYSHYWWRRQWKVEPRPFEVAVREEMQGGDVQGAEYLRTGCYADHLDMWERYFPREQLCVLLFDDLRTDADATYRRLCRHVEIDATFDPPSLGQQINTTHDVRWPRLWRATKRWRRRQELGVASQQPGRRRTMAERAALFVDARNVRVFRPPPLDARLRAELDAWFREPNRRLAERLDRDLAWRSTQS
jgi:hypothetical protein